MERAETLGDNGHAIDITTEPSSSSSTQYTQVNRSNSQQNDDPVFQHSFSTTTGTNTIAISSLFARRAIGTNNHGRSPLNSVYWISLEFVITMSQIIAAIVVLSISRHEHPRAPLSTWIIVGYASGCVASLPLLFWRFYHRNESTHHNPSLLPRQNLSPDFLSAMATILPNSSTPTTPPVRVLLSPRLKLLVEYFKVGLDWFFSAWFVIGGLWISDRYTTASDSPNLYRLCVVFLAVSCIGYCLPLILSTSICCCLPRVNSNSVPVFLQFPSLNLLQYLNRGATTESINSLPTFKFHKNGPHESTIGGGVVAAGTENERVLSEDDAVCCICLSKYENDDELRQLMCTHFFHKDCVDMWLQINDSCPLCKSEVGERALSLQTEPMAAGMQV